MLKIRTFELGDMVQYRILDIGIIIQIEYFNKYYETVYLILSDGKTVKFLNGPNTIQDIIKKL